MARVTCPSCGSEHFKLTYNPLDYYENDGIKYVRYLAHCQICSSVTPIPFDGVQDNIHFLKIGE